VLTFDWYLYDIHLIWTNDLKFGSVLAQNQIDSEHGGILVIKLCI